MGGEGRDTTYLNEGSDKKPFFSNNPNRPTGNKSACAASESPLNDLEGNHTPEQENMIHSTDDEPTTP